MKLFGETSGTNYMHFGRIIECSKCKPEKGYANYHGTILCGCICHDETSGSSGGNGYNNPVYLPNTGENGYENSHRIGGSGTLTPKTDKVMKEGWEERFDEEFALGNNGYAPSREYNQKLKSFLSSTIKEERESLIKMIVQIVESEKKKVIVNMLQDDDVFNERGMDGVRGFNQALDTISSKLKEIIKE